MEVTTYMPCKVTAGRFFISNAIEIDMNQTGMKIPEASKSRGLELVMVMFEFSSLLSAEKLLRVRSLIN